MSFPPHGNTGNHHAAQEGNSLLSYSPYLKSYLDDKNAMGGTLWRKRRNEDDEDNDAYIELVFGSDKEEPKQQTKRAQTPCSCKKKQAPVVSIGTDGASPLRAAPLTSTWYIMYHVAPEEDSPSFQRLFRQRFRLPFREYQILLEEITAAPPFQRWNRFDAAGSPPSPMPLLVLGALRYLGRGWTFDDLFEATARHTETHRQYFHVFINYGSTVLFNKYVISPVTKEEAEKHMGEFTAAGCPGCTGSTDASHVSMENCATRLSIIHQGVKEKLPSRTYNLTSNHRKRILATTSVHPARWNDKTIVLYDPFVRGIQEGRVMSDVIFELLERNVEGEIVMKKYKGVWLLVDNGYLNWPTTVPPMKHTSRQSEIRWLGWIESMRKDVECTFGILKGRFRILKTGIRLYGVDKVDKVWKTCCALHNRLLEVDGLDEEWVNGIEQNIWQGELGQHNNNETIPTSALPFALQRLHGPQERRQY